MFDLDQSIANWRRQMADGGIESPAMVDELESHLREDVEQLVRLGSSAQQAFEMAAHRIGPAKTLKAEFAKAGATPRALEKLMAIIGAVLVALILLMSGFTFFFIGYGLGEQIAAYGAVTLSLLVACRWRCAVRFLPVLASAWKRMVFGFVCIVSGFVCSSLFAGIILPHFERNRDGQIPAIGFWMLFPIAVGFGLAGAIQKAARNHTARRPMDEPLTEI